MDNDDAMEIGTGPAIEIDAMEIGTGPAIEIDAMEVVEKTPSIFDSIHPNVYKTTISENVMEIGMLLKSSIKLAITSQKNIKYSKLDYIPSMQTCGYTAPAIAICFLLLRENKVEEYYKMDGSNKDKQIHISNCINQAINANHLNCPECRNAINTNKIKNLDKSLEIAIRDDAFNHNEIDEVLKEQFANSCLQVADYSYHKLVFERWLSEAKDEVKE